MGDITANAKVPAVVTCSPRRVPAGCALVPVPSPGPARVPYQLLCVQDADGQFLQLVITLARWGRCANPVYACLSYPPATRRQQSDRLYHCPP